MKCVLNFCQTCVVPPICEFVAARIWVPFTNTSTVLVVPKMPPGSYTFPTQKVIDVGRPGCRRNRLADPGRTVRHTRQVQSTGFRTGQGT